jgi:hypothetical protein
MAEGPCYEHDLAVHLGVVRRDLDAIKTTMESMASAIQKLAVVEERQATTTEALRGLMDKFDKIDERLRVLEAAEPMQAQVSDWVMRAIWAAASAAVALVAAKAGLL